MTQSTLALAPTIAVVDGKPTTLSTDVARHFGKRHDDVLRAIRNLLPQLNADHARNFAEMVIEVEITGARNFAETCRKSPAYRLTRDGFTLLAMGFTGKKALAFKLAYIDAFNKMEAELQKPAHDPERLELAFAMATEAVAGVHRAVFNAVMTGGPDWKHSRYMVSLGYDRATGKYTAPHARAIGFDKMVVSLDELPDWISGGDPISSTDVQLARLISACARKQEQRAQHRSDRERTQKQLSIAA